MTDVTAALASAAATLTSGLRTWLGNAVDAYRAKAEQAKQVKAPTKDKKDAVHAFPWPGEEGIAPPFVDTEMPNV